MGKVLKSLAIAAVIVGVGVATGGIGFLPSMTLPATGAVVGGGLVISGTLGAALAAMAVSTVLSGVSAQLFGPKMPRAQASRLSPSLDPQAHRKFVFGETAMNTDIRYFEPSGADQEYFDYIIATSAHDVESIDSIWFDDKHAWSSGSGVLSPYVGYLTVTPITSGNASNFVSINGGSIWGSSCRLTGCSYVHFRIKRTGASSKIESPLINGLPNRVTIRGKGAKLYDPRRDSTVVGGSGTERAATQTTWGGGAATNRNNPALQLLWFLLGWKINSKLSVGCGVPPARIDLPSFITAANICDELVTLAAGGTQKRYETAGVGSDADSRMEIIQILLTSMNATLRDSNGKLSINVMKNDLATPVLEFDDDDILGEFTWNQTRGLDEMMNAVHGKYTDPSDNSLYQPVEYPVISITSIDGIERMQTLDLPWVQEGRRAQRIAKQVLQRAQYKGLLSATFTMKALGCEVGDIVYLTFSPLGWVDKPFRILTQGINNSGQVPMTMIEENAAIYAWDAEERAVVTPTAPTVYDPLNSPLILGLSDTEALADGKITSFYQASPPTADGVGDIWIDTDDENKLYRWDGTSWVLSRDTGITNAINAASDAQATADGKIVTFFQAGAPTAEAVGDLWIDSDDGNQIYRWSGTAWVLARDTGIATAIASAANAQATADSKILTFYQTTMPTGTIGDLWFDTDDGNKLYRHNGTTFVAAQDAGIGAAISAAAGAQATADGKVTTFYQAAAPTAEAVGDLWIDTDDENKLYRWSGVSWVLVRDTGIAAAISAAATAQATADSKIETFYQTTMPSGTIGDLWFDTDDGNKLYRHNGTTFVVAQDAGIGAAITAAAGAQATADGKVTTFFQASTPTASAVGDLWIDTDDANKLYRWSGTAWELARDTGIAAAIASAASAQATADSKILTFYQTTMPTGTIGDLWFDTDDGNKLYRHNGTTFVAAQDAGIGLAITAAAGAQATADGKVTTFYQDAAPTAEAVGDLWIDTNDNNKLYRWNGSTWQDSRDLGIAQAISAAATAQATADGKIETYYQTTMPTGVEGDLWFDTDDGNKLYRHNGTTFVVAQDAAIGQAITAAAGAQATADGKVTTFYTTSTPTATAVGDLWYNTSNSLLRRWDGTNWLTVSNNYTNTNQLTDGAGLGTTAVWNNVSGTGKPQDNATRNVSRGAWATSTSYIVGDIVSYNGSSYTCILAHTSSGSNTPPNATYWNLLAQSGSTPTRSPVTVQITAIGTSATIGVGLAVSEAVDAQAYLNYINLNGGATCTIKIQYSTDGTTWTDLTGTTSAAGTVGEPINIDEFGTYTNSSGSPLYVQFRAVTTKTGAGTGTVSGSFLRA